MRLNIKVVPKSSRTMVAGWLGDELKIRVAAPPERGKANDAVVALLAVTLGVPAERVRIVAGATAGRKVVEMDGLSEPDVRARLEKGAR